MWINFYSIGREVRHWIKIKMQGIFEKSILRVSGILRNLHIFFILGLSYNKKNLFCLIYILFSLVPWFSTLAAHWNPLGSLKRYARLGATWEMLICQGLGSKDWRSRERWKVARFLGRHGKLLWNKQTKWGTEKKQRWGEEGWEGRSRHRRSDHVTLVTEVQLLLSVTISWLGSHISRIVPGVRLVSLHDLRQPVSLCVLQPQKQHRAPSTGYDADTLSFSQFYPIPWACEGSGDFSPVDSTHLPPVA